MFALAFNALVPGYLFPVVSENQISYGKVSKFLGNKIIICTNSNHNKFFVSSFERLEQEGKQKIKKHIDIASSPSHSNLKYINNVYSVELTAIHNGSIKPFKISITPEAVRLSLKFSTAPPHIS